MKVLFIADIHIKLGQKNVPTAWAKERYRSLWQYLNEVIKKEKVEVIINGGDIFDRVPSMEELGEFYEMVSILSKFVSSQIIYPGNHEATGKYSTFMSHLRTSLGPYNTIVVDTWSPNFLDLGFDILPYNELKTDKWHGHTGKLLFTHVRGEIPPHVKPEVYLNLFAGWDKVFAGDLHARSNSQLNIYYPGSPVTTSFHRNEVFGENGVYIIDTETLEHTFVSLNLPQLIRKTVTAAEEMVATPYHHTIYELVGDIVDLKQVENTALLDKKISSKNKEATLNLKNLTIEEELVEYLLEVAGVSDPQAIIEEYHDSIKTTGLG